MTFTPSLRKTLSKAGELGVTVAAVQCKDVTEGALELEALVAAQPAGPGRHGRCRRVRRHPGRRRCGRSPGRAHRRGPGIGRGPRVAVPARLRHLQAGEPSAPRRGPGEPDAVGPTAAAVATAATA